MNTSIIAPELNNLADLQAHFVKASYHRFVCDCYTYLKHFKVSSEEVDGNEVILYSLPDCDVIYLDIEGSEFVFVREKGFDQEILVNELSEVIGLEYDGINETIVSEIKGTIKTFDVSVEISKLSGGESASWVIVEISTNNPVFETYSKVHVEKLNTAKYKAVPILEYLQSINSQIKQNDQTTIESHTA